MNWQSESGAASPIATNPLESRIAKLAKGSGHVGGEHPFNLLQGFWEKENTL
jgi:hypothetical protein